MRIRSVLLVVLALACLAAPALAAPAMKVNDKDVAIDLSSCIARARSLLTSYGFTGIGNASHTAWGFFNNTTTVIRCIPRRQVVVFIASGEDEAEASRLVDLLYNQF